MFGRYNNLNPYELHKHLVNEYILNRPGNTSLLKRDDSKDKTDYDVIRENHRFVWEADDVDDTWEKKLAKKYFDKLFKEYTISDLSLYKENKVALRWRVEKEIVTGKGQFICGERKCDNRLELRTWEVNFAYVEQGQKKNTLVKLRLCPPCSEKLNYRSKKREIKRLKKSKKSKSSKLREVGESSTSSNSSSRHNHSSKNKDDEEMNPVEESNVENTEIKSGPIFPIIEEKEHWTKDTNTEDLITREEEFDGYLEDLLL